MNKAPDPKHRGYAYQDLLLAYVLGASLVEPTEAVSSECKEFDLDIFDDIVLRSGTSCHIQCKHTVDASQPLKRGAMLQSGRLPLNKLILAGHGHKAHPERQLRICSTWRAPEASDFLASCLRPERAAPTIRGSQSRIFSFIPERTLEDPDLRTLAESTRLEIGECHAALSRIVFELDMPEFSQDLSAPGPLESALLRLLTERVGIGTRPNHTRSVEDVAARLIATAAEARATARTLTPSDVVRACAIVTDYGAMAQPFPFDKRQFYDTVDIRRDVLTTALDGGQNQVIVGPPGSGKSWELTKLRSELEQRGATVALHYFHIDPSDAAMEDRVQSGALLGNLMNALVSAFPGIQRKLTHPYAATEEALQELLDCIAAETRLVVLIVDGLDHIARVQAVNHQGSTDEEEVLSALTSIRCPPNVSLVVGTQPTQDISRLVDGLQAIRRDMKPWSPEHAAAFFERERVLAAIQEHTGDPRPVVQQLIDAADGNPLILTMLARECKAGLAGGSILDIESWSTSLPTMAGDVSRYYAYLYDHASRETKGVGDLVGVLDFGLTEEELKAIVGPESRRFVPEALRVLTPILTQVASYGYRIFHESFRRFVRTRIGDLSPILGPVITWLEGRGIYTDARAYHYLVPLLRQSGRHGDILALLTKEFVWRSVSYGHGRRAVDQNILLGIASAADAVDWPALARLTELRRAANTCFSEHLPSNTAYWETFVAVRGIDGLAERLAFEDAAALSSPDMGLVLCSYGTDQGAAMPWGAYVGQKEDEERAGTLDEEWHQRVLDSRVHAAIMEKGLTWACQRFPRWLDSLDSAKRSEKDLRPRRIRTVLQRLLREGGYETLDEILAATGRERAASRWHSVIELEIAEYLVNAGRGTEAERWARQACTATTDLQVVARVEELELCVASEAISVERLDALRPKITQMSGMEQAVPQWIALIRLLSRRHPDALRAERAVLPGPGWYYAWLRFVIDLALAETLREGTARASALKAAFTELTVDAQPFLGDPRPCDCFGARSPIIESLARGIQLSEGEGAVLAAFRCVRDVIAGTSVSLQRSSGGPIDVDGLIDTVWAAERQGTRRQLIARCLDELAEEEADTYFSTHAERQSRLARRLMDTNREAAVLLWENACRCYCGYGMRKDVTIFEVIDSLPALARGGGRHVAIERLARLEPYVAALQRHTDGKETRHAPFAWLEALTMVAPEDAACLVTRENTGPSGAGGYAVERDVGILLDHAHGADPLLIHLLDRTRRIEGDHEEAVTTETRRRLQRIDMAYQNDHNARTTATRALWVQLLSESWEHAGQAARVLEGFALKHAIDLGPSSVPQAKGLSDFEIRLERERREARVDGPLFGPGHGVADTKKGILRVAAQVYPPSVDTNDRFALGFGWRIVELQEHHQDVEAEALIVLAGRELTRYSTQEPLVMVAEGLEARGLTALAGRAYLSAYAHSRGANGWAIIGDTEHEQLLRKAENLLGASLYPLLAAEIAWSLRRSSYPMGVTRAIVERLADLGRLDEAIRSWEEAFEVVVERMPVTSLQSGWRGRYIPGSGEDLRLSEWLCCLLLARADSPTLFSNNAALQGGLTAFRARGSDAIRAVSRLLSRDLTEGGVVTLLALVRDLEVSPWPVSRACREILAGYAGTDHFSISHLACDLLARAGLGNPQPLGEVSIITSHQLPRGKRDAILSLDHREVLSVAEEVSPRIGMHVAERFDARWWSKKEWNQDLSRERTEMATGRASMDRPGRPYRPWEQELFLSVVNQVLMGVRAECWRSGTDFAPIREALLRRLLPPVRDIVRAFGGRVVRPPYAPLAELSNGIYPPLEIRYKGQTWLRLAYIERQVQDERAGGEGDVSLVAYGSLGRLIGGLPSEFTTTAVRTVGDAGVSIAANRKAKIGERFAAFRPILDIGGPRGVLEPSSYLISELGLQLNSANDSEVLTWASASGTAGIVYRWWEHCNGDGYSQRVFSAGGDLLIQPDLINAIVDADLLFEQLSRE